MLIFKKLIVRCGYEWLDYLKNQKVSLWKRLLVYIIDKITYKAVDKIILTSNKDKEFIIDRLKIIPEKINIFPNYIDTELFKPMILKKEEKRICFVGRLEKQKNLFNLIKAISSLSVKLIIFGEGSLKKV